MLVELGNPSPKVDLGAPAVTYVEVPDSYTYVAAYDDGQTQQIGRGADGRARHVDVTTAEELASEAAAHLGRAVDDMTQMPEQEALLAVRASFAAQSEGRPSWVWSDNADFEKLLGAFFGCPTGRPADVEMTHHTDAGPPGVAQDLDAIEAAAAAAQANDPSPVEEG